MSALAKLKLIASKRTQATNPVQHRRNKLAVKIAEQIALATAQSEGRVYAPTKLRTVTDSATGERRTEQVLKRVKEWFWTSDTGKINLSIRYGAKTLELARGKNAIELANASELVTTLETVRDAVLAGELDAQIDASSTALRQGFKQ
mgnify:CR=1 FL=1|jgi:hypothetical protein